MTDPLHPAAPVVPSAPAQPVAPAQALSDPYSGPFLIDCSRVELSEACRASLVAAWRKDGTLLLEPGAMTPLPIDLVEPHAPAHVGDRLPCHLFAPEVAWPEPLPPVLRADAPPAVMLLCSDGLGWTPFTQARFDDWLAAPIPPRRPGILRRLWADWHEWIVAGAIILFAAGVALSTHN